MKIFRKLKLIVLPYLITNSDLKGKKWFTKYFNRLKPIETAEKGYLICKYIEKNNIISLKESNSESMIYIASPYRVGHYFDGIFDRYKRLANEYLLDNDLIQFNNNDIIIDIGANVGELGLYFRKIINVNIQYHAFEPGLEEYYANKCNNFSDNDYINNLACGNRNGTITLYNKNKSGDSSIFPIENYESISHVDIVILDEYVNRNDITTIKLLKLEAEGAEPEIIRRAKNH